MKIPAVVILYNPKEEFINNFSNYIDAIDKLYVIDNSDDDIDRLKSRGKIEYIKYGENKGVASALNDAAKLAIKDGFKYLLTLDQDSKISSDIIFKMISYITSSDDKNIGLVSPYHDTGIGESLSNKEVEELVEVMTSGNIINLNAFVEVGGFKDWLFVDCVDTDYCMNLNSHGYKVVRLNTLIMKHSLGDIRIHKLFGKKYISYNHSPERMYYIVRNNLYINNIYKDLYPEHCSWLLRCLKGQAKRIVLFEGKKIKKLRMMQKGYKDFKKGKKGKLD